MRPRVVAFPLIASASLLAPCAIAIDPVPFASQVAVPDWWRTAPLAATQLSVAAPATGAATAMASTRPQAPAPPGDGQPVGPGW